MNMICVIFSFHELYKSFFFIVNSLFISKLAFYKQSRSKSVVLIVYTCWPDMEYIYLYDSRVGEICDYSIV